MGLQGLSLASPAAGIAAQRQSYGLNVADIAALRAIGPTDRPAGQWRSVDTPNAWYEFEEGSTTADDGDQVLKPDDLGGGDPGRWEKRTGSGAATPSAHASTHEDTGGDEISVVGLSGLLADDQNPTAHASDHVSGGSDPFVAADILESAARTLRTSLRNETGGSLPKGTLVAVTGFSIAEGRPTIAVADKDDSNARPAVAALEAVVANNTNFEGLVLGLMAGLDTSAFSVNDQLVLGDAGAVSRPPPDVDPFTGEIQLVGSVIRDDASNGSIYFTLSSGLLPMTAAQFFSVREISPTGGVTGGEVTRVSGLDIAVAAGSGFVNDGTDVFRVTWSAVATLALTANDTNFIFVDKNGLVQKSVSAPDLGSNIALGDAITDGTTVLLLASHQVLLTERPAIMHDYAKDVIGNVVVSGVVTTKNATALKLDVSLGTFYTRDFRVSVPVGANPITFTYWFRDGSGGFTRVASSTVIDKDNFDDGTGVLAALVATEFKKDLLFVVFTATGAVEYHVFYGQEKFTSQSEAESGNLPAADGDVIANGVRSGGIVIEGASATIASVVDVRPFVAQLAPGTTAVSDHGLLAGLSDDDHTQYLLTSGRTMTGDQNMGGNQITNVGNVDGVDVSAHKDRHKSGGADALTATDLIEAIVKRLRESGGADLLIGAVADGQFLKRVGTDLVGAAGATTFPTLVFMADQLSNPVNADWVVNALAPAVADSNNAGLTVRLFDSDIEEGVGLEFLVPAATNILITTVARAESTPAGAVVAKMRAYKRGIPKVTPATVPAFGTAVNLNDIDLLADEFFNYDQTTLTFAALGLTAGEITQLEITRNAADGGDNLLSDLALLAIIVEFS